MSIDLFQQPTLTGLAKLIILTQIARVVKLVDALDLGSSPREWLGVRLPPLAPTEYFKTSKEVQLARSPTRFAGFLLSIRVQRNVLTFTLLTG